MKLSTDPASDYVENVQCTHGKIWQRVRAQFKVCLRGERSQTLISQPCVLFSWFDMKPVNICAFVSLVILEKITAGSGR